MAAFYVTIPLANDYLLSFNQGIGTNWWSLAHYLNYTLFLMLANAAACELFVAGVFIVHLRLVTAEWLANHRRIIVVSAFILGAILTPPDVLTQCLLAGLLIFLYELLILYARLASKMAQKPVILSEHE
jgi:sec-independent protein translocase protein TatC